MDSQQEEAFSIFKRELLSFSKDSEHYNTDSFFRDILFTYIHEIAINLPEWFTILIKSKEANIIQIYDFCNTIIDETFTSFLNVLKSSIFQLKSKEEKEQNLQDLEQYCIYGLLLFNSTFLFNRALKKNMNRIIDSNIDNKEEDNSIIKKSTEKVCDNKEKEIISNITSILNHLKELNKKTYHEYTKFLSDELKIDEQFNLIVI